MYATVTLPDMITQVCRYLRHVMSFPNGNARETHRFYGRKHFVEPFKSDKKMDLFLSDVILILDLSGGLVYGFLKRDLRVIFFFLIVDFNYNIAVFLM